MHYKIVVETCWIFHFQSSEAVKLQKNAFKLKNVVLQAEQPILGNDQCFSSTFVFPSGHFQQLALQFLFFNVLKDPACWIFLPVAGHIIWRACILLLSGRIGFLKDILAADNFAVTLEASTEGQVCSGLISGLSRSEQTGWLWYLGRTLIMAFRPKYNSNTV